MRLHGTVHVYFENCAWNFQCRCWNKTWIFPSLLRLASLAQPDSQFTSWMYLLCMWVWCRIHSYCSLQKYYSVAVMDLMWGGFWPILRGLLCCLHRMLCSSDWQNCFFIQLGRHSTDVCWHCPLKWNVSHTNSQFWTRNLCARLGICRKHYLMQA